MATGCWPLASTVDGCDSWTGEQPAGKVQQRTRNRRGGRGRGHDHRRRWSGPCVPNHRLGTCPRPLDDQTQRVGSGFPVFRTDPAGMRGHRNKYPQDVVVVDKSGDMPGDIPGESLDAFHRHVSVGRLPPRGVHMNKDICHIEGRIAVPMTALPVGGFIAQTDDRGDDRGERLW